MSLEINNIYVWIVLLTKFIAFFSILTCTFIVAKKYGSRKIKFLKWMTWMFLMYSINFIFTIANTILWYIDNEYFDNSPLPVIAGSFLGLVTTFLLIMSFEIYEKEITKKHKHAIILHATLVIISIILTFMYSFYQHTYEQNKFSILVVLFTIMTYLFIFVKTINLIMHLKQDENTNDYEIKKLQNLLYASIFMIISIITLVIDHKKDKGDSGYLILAPIAYLLMTYAFYFFKKLIKN